MTIKKLLNRIDIFFRPYIYGEIKVGRIPSQWHTARIDRKTNKIEHWWFTWHETEEWDCAREFKANKKKYKRVHMPFENQI